MNRDRWHQLMKRWGAPQHDDVYAQLALAYSEPHRHYHTGQHIADCLDQLDIAVDLPTAPEEVELALWFHDAIYRPTSSKNELRSAEWAQQFLRSVGADEIKSQRVFDHIMATQHGAETLSGDTAVVVDIDLSILGRETSEYDVYERAIREEYKWVPGPIYRKKRAEILKSFLERPAIYETRHFHETYEKRARENLRRAIEALRT
jgi:predicted metal-dependent HD superfamily phosphohydrolase